MCQKRVNERVEQDKAMQAKLLEDNKIKQSRNRQVSQISARVATERIQAKKLKDVQTMNDGVEILILNQPSSIEAMNIARMLSPRFSENIQFKPEITKHSAEALRVQTLLENDRIGSYYR